MHVYTAHPQLTIQMSGLHNWFSIYTVQYLVFFMIFIFWKIYILQEIINSWLGQIPIHTMDDEKHKVA